MIYGKHFWARYADVGMVLELSAVHDDALKKNMNFVNYAVLIANRIFEELEIPCKATYGKWGARLEPDENKVLSTDQLEHYADVIITHPAWISLKRSTRLFTFGDPRNIQKVATKEDDS